MRRGRAARRRRLLKTTAGVLSPANPIHSETSGRYMTRMTQDVIHVKCPENPWVREDGLDMNGLMAAFQQFWRENADAVEVKTAAYYAKSPEAAREQMARYMDRLV